MAVQVLKPVRHSQNGVGAAPQMDLVNATGSTHVEGDLLGRTNNSVAACSGDAPTNIAFLAVTAAANSVPGQTAGYQPAIKITSNDEFEMNFYHSTASSATVADADIDDIKAFGVTFTTVSGASAWCINGADTSNKRVALIKRLDAAGDTYPRCIVKFVDGNQTSYLVHQ